jgi:two-component SAPR family response regulator
MKTILVDDMLLDLQLFELKCRDMPDFEIVGKFTDPNEAVAYARSHEVDFALLDIDMPGMDGIELARKLRELRSDVIIVFATAHTKFAVEALRMKADYMIFKPFDREDIADVLERAKLLHGRQRKRYYFHTFGVFDMMVAGSRCISAPARRASSWRSASSATAGPSRSTRSSPISGARRPTSTPTRPATAARSRS